MIDSPWLERIRQRKPLETDISFNQKFFWGNPVDFFLKYTFASWWNERFLADVGEWGSSLREFVAEDSLRVVAVKVWKILRRLWMYFSTDYVSFFEYFSRIENRKIIVCYVHIIFKAIIPKKENKHLFGCYFLELQSCPLRFELNLCIF